MPIIGSSFFSFGTFLLFNSVLNYLPDAYPEYAASVLAGNDFMRSSFGAGFPLFATAMYENLGVGWASSTLGFLSIAFIPIPFVLYKVSWHFPCDPRDDIISNHLCSMVRKLGRRVKMLGRIFNHGNGRRRIRFSADESLVKIEAFNAWMEGSIFDGVEVSNKSWDAYIEDRMTR